MKIGSISENKNIEKRIAITPEVAKKYISLGFEVFLSQNYGSHLGFKDGLYSKIGIAFSNKVNESKTALYPARLACEESMSID